MLCYEILADFFLWMTGFVTLVAHACFVGQRLAIGPLATDLPPSKFLWTWASRGTGTTHRSSCSSAIEVRRIEIARLNIRRQLPQQEPDTPSNNP